MSPTEIKEALLLSQQNGTLVEVYNFADDDTFNVGFVLATDQSFTLLLTLDWDAKINGLTAIRLTSIRQVRAQTDYLTTVAYKSQVAQAHGYFDIWGLEGISHPRLSAQTFVVDPVARCRRPSPAGGRRDGQV